MNIWIISKYASSYEVGFESRLFAIARRFVKLGNGTKIISSDSNHFGVYPEYKKVYNFHNIDGIDVMRIRTKKYYKTASIRRIFSWLDFEIKLFFAPLKNFDKPDVIIISSLSLLTILNGILLKRKFKAKLVFEIRDIWPLTMVEEGGYSHRNPFVLFLGIIERWGYLKSDLVVGTMPNLKEHVLSVTGKSDINCICIPFGFDPVFYSKKPIKNYEFSLKFDIPQNKFLVGYAGSLGLTNGLDAIIEASKKMKNDNRFHFIILGDGDLKEKLIFDTKDQKNVSFIPKVKREDVLSFLTLCNLLYISSLKSKIWKFGWSPNKLIDYMMAGKPILASYSGHKSMIDEADSGFFVPAEESDAVVKILNDIILMPPSKLQEMGMSGKKWIMNNRSWDVIANNYMDSLFKL